MTHIEMQTHARYAADRFRDHGFDETTKKIPCRAMRRYKVGDFVRAEPYNGKPVTGWIIGTYRQHGGGGIVILTAPYTSKVVHATGKRVTILRPAVEY